MGKWATVPAEQVLFNAVSCEGGRSTFLTAWWGSPSLPLRRCCRSAMIRLGIIPVFPFLRSLVSLSSSFASSLTQGSSAGREQYWSCFSWAFLVFPLDAVSLSTPARLSSSPDIKLSPIVASLGLLYHSFSHIGSPAQ